jgi:hypothetical protein
VLVPTEDLDVDEEFGFDDDEWRFELQRGRYRGHAS